MKDLLRLKRLIADGSSQPAADNSYPRRCKNLPRHLCLPVMKGLLTVLLSHQGACNVDFFVLICKVRLRIFYPGKRLKEPLIPRRNRSP